MSGSTLRSRVVALAGTLALLAPLGCLPAPAGEGADLLLVGGTLWTGVEGAPAADALAMRGGRIVYVGSSSAARRLLGPSTHVIELDGRFVAPGFIDNHTHFNRAGELLLGVNLLDVSDADGLRAAVAAAAERLPDGAWMVGGMWGAYAQWAQGSTGRDEAQVRTPFRPDRSVIDDVSADNPAVLWNWDQSQFLANGAALAAAEADCSWAGVECEGGRPTGRISNTVRDRIREAIPEKTMEQRLAEARVALRQLRELGVTTFFDITPPEQLPVFQALREAGELTARVNVRPVLDTWDELADVGIGHGFGDDWIRFGGLKGFSDGIMGNSSARFYEPYLTTGVRGSWRDATNTGHVTGNGSGMAPTGNMRRLLFGADSIGLSPRIHAIGDEAIDSVIDLMEEVIRVHGPRADRRFAIIHTQVLSGPEVAERMARLGIIAEVQPYHAIDDMRWMEERIGARARWAYAFRTLHDAGVMLSFGSDWPGTNAAWYTADPLQGMYAAVTRQTLDGQPEGGWFPEERIDIETALRAYTVGNAFAAGEEDRKGTLEVGKLADVVVLDRSPLTAHPSELKDIRVDYTIVDGRIVHQR
ncbi:MAG: amidohydrolase [Gemmatimonadota bacterium]